MDTTGRFNGLADVYTAGRPAYAAGLIDHLYTRYGFREESVIADIGAGTGKLSERLLDRGSTVYCVEPNPDMRDEAIKALGSYDRAYVIDGTAADTGLKDRSVDFITVAQAFHWFDPLLFKKECKRILRGDGLVCLIWNMRDMSSEVNVKNQEIFSRYCPRFKGFGGGIGQDDIRIRQFFADRYTYIEFDHPLVYDRETFICRCLSGSYSLQSGDAGYDRYREALCALYEQYAEDGQLVMANKTVAYLGKVEDQA